MMKRARRILVALAIGLALIVMGIWLLARGLEEGLPRYQGQLLQSWLQQADSQDPAASNHACLVLTTTVIPQLTETMFHDKTDSRFRATLIDWLNTLPGIQIYSTAAEGRRATAAQAFGQMGQHAAATVPDLIRAIKGSDPAPRPGAAWALGEIHNQPETVIPLLIALLDDPQDGVPENAAEALGHFGPLSKAAVPKLLQMSKIPDKEMRKAVSTSLKQIAPEEAAKLGVM
jgi:hypothetical protein